MLTEAEFEHLIARCESGSSYVGSGWRPLVAALFYALDSMLGESNWRPGQVKEKYGGLRFYCDISENVPEDRQEAAERLVETVERVCNMIAEDEGGPGELRRLPNGWVKCQPISAGEVSEWKTFWAPDTESDDSDDDVGAGPEG